MKVNNDHDYFDLFNNHYVNISFKNHKGIFTSYVADIFKSVLSGPGFFFSTEI